MPWQYLPFCVVFDNLKNYSDNFKNQKLPWQESNESMIGLMPKIGMPTFGKYQILASAWLVTEFACQPHKKLPIFDNFWYCQLLACQVLAMPNVGIKPIILWICHDPLWIIDGRIRNNRDLFTWFYIKKWEGSSNTCELPYKNTLSKFIEHGALTWQMISEKMNSNCHGLWKNHSKFISKNCHGNYLLKRL